MTEALAWLATNEALSGWAQFAGSMLALIVTYFTAFAPHWRRRSQLENASKRLLMHSYECLESYHRTSAFFLPTAISVRAAGLSMVHIANEIDRFPIFELRDQGGRSTARSLVAVSGMLRLVNLALDSKAVDLKGRDGTVEDQEILREFVGGQLKLVEKIISGAELTRPAPSEFNLV